MREFYGTKEAAELLGMSVGSLQNLRSQGRGPKYGRDGKIVRYHISELRKWMGINEAVPSH